MGRNSRNITPNISFVSHLIRFIGFNVGFALLPLVASVAIRILAEITPPPDAYAQELLFFAVSVSAAALGDLTDEKFTGGVRWLFDLLKVVLIISVAVAALLFGFYQYEAIIGPGNANIRNNITPLAIGVAISTFTVSLTAETLIAYTRRKDVP